MTEIGGGAAETYDIEINDPALEGSGFTKFSLPLNGKGNSSSTMMTLYHEDKSKIIYCHFYKSDLDKTVKSFEQKLLSSDELIDDNIARSLVTYFRNQCLVLREEDPNFFNGSGNGKLRKKKSNSDSSKQQKKEEKEEEEDQQQQPPKRQFTAYKYSNKCRIPLHEAVILSGRPVFLKYENCKIEAVDKVEEDIRIIKPLYAEHHPYEPFEFVNMNEVLSYGKRASRENIDSLYLQAKQIAGDYNDQKKDKVNLLAIEIIASYFQDKFPTTHYDIVLGGNGSGKSTYGDTFTAVGYRVVNLTDPNAANINRILGVVEIGQCTIVSDETGAIDKHQDLMSILKTGYSAKGKTSKINDNSREPEFFFTYCFKMIISERMPNLRDARGVLDRSFSFTTYKGKPKYDIKETLEPQGNPARQERLDVLNDFRKLMLVYRLLHSKDPIADLNVGVEGREKELSKPIIQLFYNTKAQKEVEMTLQNFLNLRTEKKEITLEPIIHLLVTNLITKYGNELYVKTIWDAIKETIEGYSEEKRPNEYQTLEYGTIYNNSISNILEHTFGGRPKHRENGNIFLFDSEELSRVGKAYNLTTEIQTKIADNDIIEEEYRSRPEGSEGSEGYTEEPTSQNEDKESGKEDNSLGNSFVNSRNNGQNTDNNGVEPSPGHLEPSDPSGQVLEKSSTTSTTADQTKKIPSPIYRLSHSDTWACHNCKQRDDRWFMEKHLCKGVPKK